jgi:peptidoglycan hydrolase CwlO-like protein
MNRKKIAAIVVFGLTMTTCATPAVGQATKEDVINYTSEYNKQSIIDFFEAQEAKQTQLEEEAEAARKLEADTALVNKALKKLNSHVNKTWYVFSGSTPR